MFRLAVISVAFILAGCASGRRPPALMFERSAPAVRLAIQSSDLTGIQLVGGVTDMTIEGTSDSAITAEILLRSRDRERLRRECVESSRLDTTRVRGVFRMVLRQSSRKQCGETWRVRVPAWHSVEVQVSNGAIDFSRVEGGIHVQVSSTGKISGTVSGDVDVSMGVGDIDLASTQASYEVVDLTSDVGRVGLTLAGYKIRSDGRPGAGDHVRVTGPGNGIIRARARVGDVLLRVGRER